MPELAAGDECLAICCRPVGRGSKHRRTVLGPARVRVISAGDRPGTWRVLVLASRDVLVGRERDELRADLYLVADRADRRRFADAVERLWGLI